MDLFYDMCNQGKGILLQRKSRRVHFNEFMLDFHRRMHVLKQQPNGAQIDAIPHIARELAGEARLLCFDEFQVTDIADAVVLKRLFSYFFALGVTVVVCMYTYNLCVYLFICYGYSNIVVSFLLKNSYIH